MVPRTMVDRKTEPITDLDHLVQRVSDRWREGHPPDPSAIKAAYPHLMPELGEWLDSVQAIQAASGIPADPEATDEQDGGLDLLREKLEGYTVVGRIKHGGQGTVYMAQQHGTERTVAIKLLLPNPDQRLRSRFAREVELLTRLEHANIVTVYETGEVYDRPYIVMEYVAGLPLDDYVYFATPTLKETVRLFRLICLAVGAAHEVGIIHRDLKPSNILVTPDGQPHVLDFGLATDVSGEAAQVTVSLTGHVVGTLPYMSPEQVTGQRDIMDVRTDIYSLGVVLYELISGAYPYPIDADRALAARYIATATPERLRDAVSERYAKPASDCRRVHEDLERIVFKSLSKEPVRRYHSAAEFADDLERFLNGEAVVARADSSIYVLKKALRRYRTQAIVAASFVVLLVGGLVEVTRAWRAAAEDAAIMAAALNMVGHTRLGGWEREYDNPDEAIAAYTEAIAIAEDLQSDNLIVRQYYFAACYWLADTLMKNGRTEEAKELTSRAVQIAEATCATEGEDPEWVRQLANAYHMEAILLGKLNNWRAVRARLEMCVQIRRRLLADDPDRVSLRADLGTSVGLLAKALRRSGLVTESWYAYVESWQLRAGCVERAPSVRAYQRLLAEAEIGFAAWHLSQCTPHNPAAADAWLRSAQARLEDLPQDREVRATSNAVHINRLIAEAQQKPDYEGGGTGSGSTGSSVPETTGSSSPE